MSSYPLSKLLYRLGTEPELLGQFRANPGRVLEGVGVHSEERAAVERQDFRWLLDRGVHPILLMQLALALNVDIRRAYAADPGDPIPSKP